MKIIVLLKQVPDTTEIKINFKTGTLIRDGVKSIMNPDDKAGLEEALVLKDRYNAHVTAITMGPPQAKKMLKEALSMGCDEAFLISDAKFAGADTWATSSTLAGALKKMDYDLIIAGRQAIDGDTAQVGPQTAEKLDLSHVTYVCKVEGIEDGFIKVHRQYEDCYHVIKLKLPCLITTLQEMNKPRYMNTARLVDAMNYDIKVLKFEDIDVPLIDVGLKGSPTQVKKTFTKDATTRNELFTGSYDEAAKIILDKLVDYKVI